MSEKDICDGDIMKKLFPKILIIFGVLFIVYNIIGMFSSSDETIIAQLEQVETTFSFDGVITRDEICVTASDAGISQIGVLDPAVSEGEMVSRGKLVLVHYDSSIDDETKKRLSEINSRLSEFESSPDDMNAMEVDEKTIDAEIEKQYSRLFDTAKKRDMREIAAIKNEINLLIARKAALSEDSDKAMETRESLEAEKTSILNRYGGKTKEILSEKHGVFSTSPDGYESILTPDIATSMTVSDFEKIMKKDLSSKQAVKDGTIYKICDNSKWWISVCTNSKTAQNFSEDSTITLRLGGENKEIRATVEYISPALNGKYVITFSSNSHSEYALSNRFVSVTAVTEVYKGLMVPIKAIRVIDSKPGVYVRTETTVKFRNIEIIYKDKEKAIVKMNNTGNNPLLLYDEIIVSGKKELKG